MSPGRAVDDGCLRLKSTPRIGFTRLIENTLQQSAAALLCSGCLWWSTMPSSRECDRGQAGDRAVRSGQAPFPRLSTDSQTFGVDELHVRQADEA